MRNQDNVRLSLIGFAEFLVNHCSEVCQYPVLLLCSLFLAQVGQSTSLEENEAHIRNQRSTARPEIEGCTHTVKQYILNSTS